MVLGSNQSLREMSTRINGGKGGRCVRLTTLPPSCAVVTNSGNLNLLGLSGPGMGLLYFYLYFQFYTVQELRYKGK